MFWLAYREKRKFKLIFIFLILMTTTYLVNQSSLANPIIIKPPTYEEYFMGGILPENMSHSLQMTKADVYLTVNTGFNAQLKVNFDGFYHIYNSNSTSFFPIAAPFSSVFKGLSKTVEVRVNGTLISHELVETGYLEPLEWSSYLNPAIRVFIISNISFEHDSTTILEYTWSAAFEPDSDYVFVKYDIGTGKAWNDTLTERIEFKVKGAQPDRITDNNEFDRLQIEQKPFAKYYVWSWEDEPFSATEVGLIFNRADLNSVSNRLYFGICVYVLLSINVLLLIGYLTRRRNMRGASK